MRHPERCPAIAASAIMPRKDRCGNIQRRPAAPQFKQDIGAANSTHSRPRFRGVNSSGGPELTPCAGLVSFRVGEVAGVASLARDFARPSMRINA